MEQLSLLGLEPPSPLHAPTAVAGKIKPKVPPALDGVDFPATPPAPRGLWQHPQANRQAVLQGQAVGYWFRRGQRRTIGFSVGSQGLSVSAPRWSTLASVDAALQVNPGTYDSFIGQGRGPSTLTAGLGISSEGLGPLQIEGGFAYADHTNGSEWGAGLQLRYVW